MLDRLRTSRKLNPKRLKRAGFLFESPDIKKSGQKSHNWAPAVTQIGKVHNHSFLPWVAIVAPGAFKWGFKGSDMRPSRAGASAGTSATRVPRRKLTVSPDMKTVSPRVRVIQRPLIIPPRCQSGGCGGSLLFLLRFSLGPFAPTHDPTGYVLRSAYSSPSSLSSSLSLPLSHARSLSLSYSSLSPSLSVTPSLSRSLSLSHPSRSLSISLSLSSLSISTFQSQN